MHEATVCRVLFASVLYAVNMDDHYQGSRRLFEIPLLFLSRLGGLVILACVGGASNLFNFDYFEMDAGCVVVLYRL
jgi:hypothetical protein